MNNKQEKDDILSFLQEIITFGALKNVNFQTLCDTWTVHYKGCKEHPK